MFTEKKINLRSNKENIFNRKLDPVPPSLCSYLLFFSNTKRFSMENSSPFPALNAESTVLIVLEVIFVFLLIIFGLIGNFGVCAMVYTHRHLQTIPNYLIVNLSISDLLRIFFTLSISAGVLIKRSWISGITFCHVNGCYTLIFLVASLMSVTLISVNRYFLIVRPNESATFFSQRRTRAMLFTLWFLAVFIAIPPILGWGHYGFFASRATCFIAVGSSYSYTSFLVIAFITMPFSCLIWCYMKIYLAMKKSKRRVLQKSVRTLPTAMSEENSERLKKEVSGFNLCLVPHFHSSSRVPLNFAKSTDPDPYFAIEALLSQFQRK